MKTLSRYLIPFLLGTVVVLTATAARDTGRDRHDGPADREDREDSDGATARVKFSDATKPGTLKLSLPWAEVHVTATDGNEVIVTSTLDEKGRHREVDHEGFRRLDEDQTFELIERNNVATVVVAGESSWVPQGAEFDIKVPRNTNLILRTEAGGDINVEGVEGDIDVNSMNGEITLTDIGSSAVVNSMNGEIHVSFKKAPSKPVSLSSMNGEIELRLPNDTKANLRMRTHNGSIRTNFAEGALQTKTEKTSPRYTPGTPEAVRDAARDAARDQARAERDLAKAERDRARAAGRAEAPEAPAAPTAPTAPAAPEVRVNTQVSVVIDPEVVIAPMPPIPALPNFGGKSIVGTLNGGGVDIKLTSMNGTITLRESK